MTQEPLEMVDCHGSLQSTHQVPLALGRCLESQAGTLLLLHYSWIYSVFCAFVSVMCCGFAGAVQFCPRKRSIIQLVNANRGKVFQGKVLKKVGGDHV